MFLPPVWCLMIDDSGEDGDDTDDAEETTDCCLDPEHELFN